MVQACSHTALCKLHSKSTLILKYPFKNHNWKPYFLFEQLCFTILLQEITILLQEMLVCGHFKHIEQNSPLSTGHNKAFSLLYIIAYLNSHRVTEGDQNPRPHLSQGIFHLSVSQNFKKWTREPVGVSTFLRFLAFFDFGF